MGWVITAVVGGSIIGGIASSRSSRRAARAQSKATTAASRSAEAQLAFQKEQYQDWQEVYGSIQDNLAEFYQNYDAEQVTALGLQNIEREYTASKKALVREMAQRGLDTSGLTAAGLTQLGAAKASEKATVRSNAGLQAARAQQSFLGMGLGLESSLQQGIAGAYQNQTAIHSQAAIAHGQQSAAAAAGVGQAISGIGTGLATFAQTRAMGQPLLQR